MAVIPYCVAETDLSRKIRAAHLPLLNRGKVRDTWALPGHPEALLAVTTDRLSAYDFVLPARVRSWQGARTKCPVDLLERQSAG